MRDGGIDQGPGSIAVHDLEKRYGAVTAVDCVSFEVASGEFLALLGPSCSGKTTVLMSIAGFEFPDQGRVLIGVTVLFVTHDQTEALTMADRVAVLDQGRLQQLGSPRELYEAPATPFVAGFVGETNFCAGIVRDAAGMGERVSATLDGGMAMDAIAAMPLPAGARISVALRGRSGCASSPAARRMARTICRPPSPRPSTPATRPPCCSTPPADHRLRARIPAGAGMHEPRPGEAVTLTWLPADARAFVSSAS